MTNTINSLKKVNRQVAMIINDLVNQFLIDNF